MRIYTLYLSLIVGLFLCTNALAQNHYLIFIHGIAANEGSFDDGPEALASFMNKNQNESNYISKTFTYPTGKDQYSTVDFAQMFEKYISTIPFGPADKFSLICHSQGGLVALNWLRLNFLNDSGYQSNSLIANRLAKVATLGTPFFGTQIVKVPLYLKKLKDFIFGKKELKDMLFGSQMLNTLRDTFFYDKDFQHFISHVDMINIRGNFSLANTSSLSFLLEDDLAVPVPSAQLNFDHYIDHSLPDPFSPNKKMKIFTHDKIKKITIARPHMTFLKKGLAKVPSECVDDFSCEHEGFQILSHFFANDLSSLQVETKDPESFYVHLRLNIPRKSRYTMLTKKEYYDVELRSVLGDDKIEAGAPFFFNATTLKEDEKSKGYVDLILAGKLKSDQLRSAILRVRVDGPYLVREIPINVKRGKAVIVDLSLYGLSDYYPHFK